MFLRSVFSRCLIAASLLLSGLAQAALEVPDATVLEADFRQQSFGDYTVHFSTFNSVFITPEVAELYGITRARNQALINISVTKTDGDKTGLGLPAKITGTARNLLQQQRVLDFAEIDEGYATYYLAPLKHTKEEVFHFTISVTPTGQEHSNVAPMTVKFTRKLYLQESH